MTIARIAEAIARGVRLVVLDPLNLFLEGLDDEHVDLKVRSAMSPMVDLAQTPGAAIVGIKHVNKSEGRAVMNRIAGSRGSPRQSAPSYSSPTTPTPTMKPTPTG